MSDKQKTIRDFLDTISHLETSRGTNMDHKEMKSGMHKGDKAAGQYGIMPNTMKEMVDRYDLNYTPTPDKAGELMADLLYDKTGGDKEAMAAGWNQGHNQPLEKLKQLRDKDYVQKFNKEEIKKELKPRVTPFKELLKLLNKR